MLRLALATLSVVSCAAVPPSAHTAQEEPGSHRKRVAVLVFEGVELLDFAGPVEVFSQADDEGEKFFDVYLVAARTGPLATGQSAELFVRHSLETCPEPDLIVVPGGEIGSIDDATRAWIARASAKAEITMSVCNGAFVLAELGLLDGLDVTTFWSFTGWLQQDVPSARVHNNVRVCDNGRIVTTAGVSAGIDGALHLVERLCGSDIAFETARGMEYTWQPTALAADAADFELRSRARRAAQALVSRQWEDAVAAHRALLELAPEMPRAARKLGDALVRLGRDAEAGAAYKQAVATDPNDASTWDQLALLYARAARHVEAAQCYRRVLEAGWDFPNKRTRMAGQLNLAGDRDGAIEALRVALRQQWGDRHDLQIDSALASLYRDQRFRELLREHARAAPLSIAPETEPGDVLEIHGAVVDVNDRPVAGALVSVYQADASGHYTEGETRMDEAHARLFGFVRTGERGEFIVKTVRPGGYPPAANNGGASRLVPAHVHLDVEVEGCAPRRAQLVFRDDPRMDEHWHEWARRLAQPLVDPVRLDDGTWRAEVTLRLAEAIEGQTRGQGGDVMGRPASTSATGFAPAPLSPQDASGVVSGARPCSFVALGDLPGGKVHSEALVTSADGAVVAGQASCTSGSNGLHAFTWTQSGGIMAVEGFPKDTVRSQPRSISADGRILVGNFGTPDLESRAFCWSRERGFVLLAGLDGREDVSGALDVSADGRVIVGWGASDNGGALRWVDGKPEEIGDLPGGSHHSAAGLVSRDGRIVVGSGTSERGHEAFVWTEAGGFVALGDAPGGKFSSEPFGMSGDGTTIVGEATSEKGLEAFRWTEAAGMRVLGDLPEGRSESRAFDVSADGKRVVGYGHSARGSEAVVWDRDTGPRSLRDLLLAAGELSVEAWALTAANAISDDGCLIVGDGTAPDGSKQGWRVELAR